MKYNLLTSYCTFFAFYLLLKVDGKSVDNHPVIHKLTHIKTLFEQLQPLDEKLQLQFNSKIGQREEEIKSNSDENSENDADASVDDDEMAEEGESEIDEDEDESDMVVEDIPTKEKKKNKQSDLEVALGRDEMEALEQEAMTSKEKKALHKRNFKEI